MDVLNFVRLSPIHALWELNYLNIYQTNQQIRFLAYQESFSQRTI